MPIWRRWAGLLLVWVPLRAEVRLPALFSDHAVMQRAEHVPVWGQAAPGEVVSVTLGAQTGKTTAGPDGHWQVQLDLSSAPPGPCALEVKAASTITVNDVLIGEVWLASGQSNMEWVVANTTGAKEVIARSANPAIRHFRVVKNTAAIPTAELQGKWEVAAPATTGGFSATGYFFATTIQAALGVPVGVINSSWGGTPVEAWTSERGLAPDPALKASAERYQADDRRFPAVLHAYEAAWTQWAVRFDRRDQPQPEPPPGQPWVPVSFPSDTGSGLPPAGVAWLRKSFVILPQESGLQQAVTIGPIDGFFTAYLNGQKIAEVTPTTGQPPPGAVYVRGDLIREGSAVFSVRIFNPAGTPTIRGKIPLRFNGRELPGEWEVQSVRALPPLAEPARTSMPNLPAQPPSRQNIATYLYNGMIAPLVPYRIKGVIWYQGESNTGRAWQYRITFPLLIQDWRNTWGIGDFPFYFCQLANFGEKRSAPIDAAWAELREAQSLALKLPNTGQAVLVDAGEADDVHARDKQVVGLRLATIALSRTYGLEQESSGPVYQAMSVEGSRIRLQFSHQGGGLVATSLPRTYQPRSTVDLRLPLIRNSPDSQLEGFSICGADRKWVWAQAAIEGDTVVVSSASVTTPVAVRYAWAANPSCNLYNRSGLPAAPFRTDDFPLSTTTATY